MMRRREFITGLGVAAAWPLAARAQQPTSPMIGFLHASSADGYAKEYAEGFRAGLHESGYIDGHNIAIEYRWADGHYDRLPDLAADLVRRHVAVIFAAPAISAVTAKQSTDAVPIVFELGADPVGLGLVSSLNRPGGNITGIVNLSNTLVAKRVEFMHEIVPNAELIAVLLNPDNPTFNTQMSDVRAVQNMLGVQIEVLKARAGSEVELAFADLREIRAGALVVGADPFLVSQQNEIAALATRYAVPTSHEVREFVTAGGLISYGSDIADAYRLAGIYAGRILKGEKPADLPVQQATKVRMTINLKAAKALGLTIPLPLLGRADEVIE
jgi:putative tryptophan/tyrosine transport system substrate-binding protein